MRSLVVLEMRALGESGATVRMRTKERFHAGMITPQMLFSFFLTNEFFLAKGALESFVEVA